MFYPDEPFVYEPDPPCIEPGISFTRVADMHGFQRATAAEIRPFLSLVPFSPRIVENIPRTVTAAGVECDPVIMFTIAAQMAERAAAEFGARDDFLAIESSVRRIEAVTRSLRKRQRRKAARHDAGRILKLWETV